MTEPRFDDVVHARHRLQICGLLSDVEAVSFATVRETLEVNDYVVSKHVKVLVEAGYVEATKTRDLGRPQTWLRLTSAGQAAFHGHLAALREITAPHEHRPRAKDTQMARTTRRHGRRAATCAVVVLLLAACGQGQPPSGEPTDPPATHELPTSTPSSPEPTSPEPATPGDLPAEVEAAVADLAAHLGVDTGAVVVVSHEDVTWPDGSLGCPQPGMSYTQALVPGTRLVLEVDGREYPYHSGRDTPLVRCDPPTLG